VKNFYQRLLLLAGLVFLLVTVVFAKPQSVHTSVCECLHWSGLDGPCDECCKHGYTYCQSTGGKGTYTCSTDTAVNGPCQVFITTQVCDNFFGCLTCTDWSCGGL